MVPVDEGKGFHVVGRNMCGIVVHEEMYGRRAVEAVRARIPAQLFLATPAASPTTPVAPGVRSADRAAGGRGRCCVVLLDGGVGVQSALAGQVAGEGVGDEADGVVAVGHRPGQLPARARDRTHASSS